MISNTSSFRVRIPPFRVYKSQVQTKQEPDIQFGHDLFQYVAIQWSSGFIFRSYWKGSSFWRKRREEEEKIHPHSAMSYNGSGALIHHHHHDYGYHHLVAGIRSPTVSSAPDSSFVGAQDHHQRLDCSMSAALTGYHPHQPTIGATDCGQTHQAEQSQSIGQPISQKAKSSANR